MFWTASGILESKATSPASRGQPDDQELLVAARLCRVADGRIQLPVPHAYAYLLPASHTLHWPAIVTPDGGTETRLPTTHLDGSQFESNPEEEAFLKAETGSKTWRS